MPLVGLVLARTGLAVAVGAAVIPVAVLVAAVVVVATVW